MSIKLIDKHRYQRTCDKCKLNFSIIQISNKIFTKKNSRRRNREGRTPGYLSLQAYVHAHEARARTYFER